jgi:hypothetical protein
VNPQSGTAAFAVASSVPMFPCVEAPAAAGLQAYCRSAATVARVAAAVVEASAESWDRSVVPAFAGRAAAGDSDPAIAQNDGLVQAAGKVAGLHIFAAMGRGSFVPTVMDSSSAVRFDNGVVRRADLVSVRYGSAASGSVVGWGAAWNDHYDDSERDTAPSPRSA